MAITIRALHEREIPELFVLDGRNFGHTHSADDIDDAKLTMEPERFRVALDGRDLVGVTGSYTLQMTMPGGSALPTAGVTWVSVAATHRRQGVLTRLMAASIVEATEHGDPLCALTASEGGIYGRFGYGAATQTRVLRIDHRSAQLRAGVAEPGTVRAVSANELALIAPEIYDRYRMQSPGEVTRHDDWWRRMFDGWSKPLGAASIAFHLAHRDGYACYRIEQHWNLGHPSHTLTLVELVAATPAAHAALWQVVLGVDLVGSIESRNVPIDDPLPLLLTNPRAARTIELNDGLWVRVLDVAAVLAARRYGTDDELVVEVVDEARPATAGRFRIAGSPDGASCRRDRRRADLVVPVDALGSIVLGGVRPSWLARGGRLEARDAATARRADAFFLGERAPHAQTMF